MKSILIIFLLSSGLAFAADIECAVQTRNEAGVSAGPPQSIGFLLDTDDPDKELFIKQENFNLLVVRMGPASVATGIYDFKSGVVANTEEAPVNYQTFVVVQDFIETGATHRSATILCRLK